MFVSLCRDDRGLTDPEAGSDASDLINRWRKTVCRVEGCEKFKSILFQA